MRLFGFSPPGSTWGAIIGRANRPIPQSEGRGRSDRENRLGAVPAMPPFRPSEASLAVLRRQYSMQLQPASRRLLGNRNQTVVNRSGRHRQADCNYRSKTESREKPPSKQRDSATFSNTHNQSPKLLPVRKNHPVRAAAPRIGSLPLSADRATESCGSARGRHNHDREQRTVQGRVLIFAGGRRTVKEGAHRNCGDPPPWIAAFSLPR